MNDTNDTPSPRPTIETIKAAVIPSFTMKYYSLASPLKIPVEGTEAASHTTRLNRLIEAVAGDRGSVDFSGLVKSTESKLAEQYTDWAKRGWRAFAVAQETSEQLTPERFGEKMAQQDVVAISKAIQGTVSAVQVESDKAAGRRYTTTSHTHGFIP